MPRARNIKPSFFKNESLAQCEHGARLLFAGLWCLADREGRLEDRPLKIRAELFPYEQIDIDCWLNALQENGFILRYSANNIKYIQILTFNKHQNPHIKEQASTIPAPEMHCASTVVAGLIPDSLNPIPDTLIPEEKHIAKPQAVCPYQQIVDLYHECLPNNPRVVKLTGKRKSHIKSRWLHDLQSLDQWRNYFEDVSESKFLTGQVKPNGDRKVFIADIDFLINESNLTKVAERKYHDVSR